MSGLQTCACEQNGKLKFGNLPFLFLGLQGHHVQNPPNGHFQAKQFNDRYQLELPQTHQSVGCKVAVFGVELVTLRPSPGTKCFRYTVALRCAILHQDAGRCL
ncbi:MAG: hypothetical protein JSS10_08635 [Verrucomicrobia bacterium]|nr:hypothetical protein [Verrucomicrobiota bacterium]